MKIKKASNVAVELKELKRELIIEQDRLEAQKELVSDIKRQIFDLEVAPYKSGDHVIMKVSHGRTTKECECLLSIGTNSLGNYEFRAYPYKNDGTLSNRSFIVYELSQIRLAGGK